MFLEIIHIFSIYSLFLILFILNSHFLLIVLKNRGHNYLVFPYLGQFNQFLNSKVLYYK